MKLRLAMVGLAAVAAAGVASQAAAQTPRSPILGGSIASIRAEVDKRYEAAVAATRSREIVAANDARYTWASETKVACGIAIGYLKTRTVDEDSINKCDAYYARMIAPPPPPAPPPPMAGPAGPCVVKLPITFYFEWDVATPPAEAAGVAAQTAESMRRCGYRNVLVAGHADTSGPTTYNVGLSDRRARNVADLLAGAGVQPQSIQIQAFGESRPAVQTGDGVREPLNRRVEVTDAAGQ